MKKRFLVALALSASLLGSTAANAASFIYTFSGDFEGTLAGAAFSTAVGDTDTLSMTGLTKYVNLTSVSALAGGTTYNILSTTQFYLNGGNYAGLFFGSNGDGGGAFSGTGPGLACYDAVSSLATTPLTDYFTGPVSFLTDKGTVTLSSFSNGSFGAVANVAAVPEPATWAMMLLGFGAIGFGMRRRRGAKTIQTQVRFAV